MLRKNTSFHFGIQEGRSFEKFRTSSVSPPVLHLYNPELVTELHTDASKFAFEGILLQLTKEDVALASSILL